MKKSSVLTWVAAAAVAGTSGCSSTDPASLAFVRNAQTVETVFRAFEAEDPAAFWGGLQKLRCGEVLQRPDDLVEEEDAVGVRRVWAEFDYELMEPPHPCQADHETQRPNGSVNGMFLWEVSKTAKDGSRKAVQLCIYESFDFNDDGDIVFTQVFSDLTSAYRILRNPPLAASNEAT